MKRNERKRPKTNKRWKPWGCTHTHTHTCSASGYLAYNNFEYISETQERYICGCRYVSAVSFCCALLQCAILEIYTNFLKRILSLIFHRNSKTILRHPSTASVNAFRKIVKEFLIQNAPASLYKNLYISQAKEEIICKKWSLMCRFQN